MDAYRSRQALASAYARDLRSAVAPKFELTAELVALLIRYRLVRRFAIVPLPCSNGQQYCVRS